MRQIAQYRAEDKSNPEYYARLTVEKAQAALLHKPFQKSSKTPQTTSPSDLRQGRNT
jgi:hypothetical protein